MEIIHESAQWMEKKTDEKWLYSSIESSFLFRSLLFGKLFDVKVNAFAFDDSVGLDFDAFLLMISNRFENDAFQFLKALSLPLPIVRHIYGDDNLKWITKTHDTHWQTNHVIHIN